MSSLNPFLVISLIVLSSASVSFAQDDYATRIQNLKAEDQRVRKEFGVAMKEGLVTDSLRTAMVEDDRAHNAELKALIENFGFPDASKVGMDATHAFWILAMHQDKDTTLQGKILEWMREAVKRDDALTRDLAYLEDRVAVNAGQCQTYGTQVDFDEKLKRYVSFPICDKRKMKKLRKEMKLMSLEAQLKQENQSFKH